MAIRITALSDLTQLQNLLKNFLPRSLFSYHVTKFLAEGYYPTTHDPACFVDNWPNPTLIWNSFVEKSELLHTCSFTVFLTNQNLNLDIQAFCTSVGNQLGLFTGNYAFLAYLLQEAGLAETVVKCFHIHSKKHKLELVQEPAQLWWLNPLARERLKRFYFPIPPDLYLDTVREDEAVFVDSTWPHRFPGSDSYWRDRIKHLPSVCLRKKSDNSLVAWSLVHFMGFGAHGYVIPEFRGSNLISAFHNVPSKKKRVDEGWFPYGMIMDGNVNSIKASKKPGLFERTLYDVDILICECLNEEAQKNVPASKI